MTNTPNLSLPYLAAAQAQKHVTVNEALGLIDALTQLAVSSVGATSPPTTPNEGERHIIGTSATGAWASWDDSIALFSNGAWLRLIPQPGWKAWDVSAGELLIWSGSAWGAYIPSLQNLAGVGIGTTSDATNKLAISAIATLLNHAGNGHQLKINKAANTDTASLLFQTNWSGRAEMGTAGNDDFSIKVSADGNNFLEGMRIDRNTGAASFPGGMEPERHSVGSITKAGGSDWWGAVDPFTLSYSSSSQQALSQNRMFFMAFHVDRPIQLLGAFVSLNVASTTAGALLRCGIYRLGTPNGDLWDIGDRVADFGTLPADVADNKEFNLATPQTLTKGWYVTAMGVSGAGAYARYARWMTPGLTRFYPHSSGTSAYPQTVAPQVYLYASSSNAEITGGLPANWASNPVTTMTSTNNWVYQMVFPKWREV
ncbi:MAG: DUF2793 domain-containing protein [Alphaproteobacteria bacterium]